MSISKMSAPTPSNLNIVLLRRLKNGCDFGSGGGASGIGRDWSSEIASAIRIERGNTCDESLSFHVTIDSVHVFSE